MIRDIGISLIAGILFVGCFLAFLVFAEVLPRWVCDAAELTAIGCMFLVMVGGAGGRAR